MAPRGSRCARLDEVCQRTERGARSNCHGLRIAVFRAGANVGRRVGHLPPFSPPAGSLGQGGIGGGLSGYAPAPPLAVFRLADGEMHDHSGREGKSVSSAR